MEALTVGKYVNINGYQIWPRLFCLRLLRSNLEYSTCSIIYYKIII